jgi:hyperosmotically inducible periplasmic protein
MNAIPSTGVGRFALLTALLGASVLTACGQQDDRSAGQKLDSAVANVQQAGEDVQRGASKTLDASTQAVSDVTIMAKIKAALALDAQLSATKIEVDSVEGKVTLRGTAPDAQTVARATALAQAVEGVRAVDNQLVVSSQG